MATFVDLPEGASVAPTTSSFSDLPEGASVVEQDTTAQPSTRELVSQAIVEPAIETFASGVEQFSQDPRASLQQSLNPLVQGFVDVSSEVASNPKKAIEDGLVTSLDVIKSFAKSVADEGLAIVLASAFEEVGERGVRRTPIGRTPVVGEVLESTAGNIGEIAGSTLGKVLQQKKPTQEAFQESLLEAIGGRVIAAAGDEVIPNRGILSRDSVDAQQLIRDAEISNVVENNVRRTFTQAQEELGTNLPSFMKLEGTAFGQKQGEKLRKEIEAATKRAGGDFGSTAFYQDALKGTLNTVEKAIRQSSGINPELKYKQLDSSLKSLVEKNHNTILKDIPELANKNNTIASTSKETIPADGMVERLVRFGEQQGAFIGREASEDVYKTVNNILTENGVPKQKISLKDWAKLENSLDDLVSQYTTKDRASEIAGVVAAAKRDLIQPTERGLVQIASESPVAAPYDFINYINNKNTIRETYAKLDDVYGTKLSTVANKNEIAQAKKALTENRAFDTVASSAESYRQAKKMMEIADPAAIELLDQRVIADSMEVLGGKSGVITTDGIQKLIGSAAKPTPRREVLNELNPQIVSTLEDSRLVLQGLENFAETIIKPKAERVGAAQNLVRIAAGTAAGQGLIVGTAKANLIRRGIEKARGTRARADAGVLANLSSEAGQAALENAIATRLVNDNAYRAYRQIMTAATIRPMNEEEFQATYEAYRDARSQVAPEATGEPTVYEFFNAMQNPDVMSKALLGE